MKCPKLGRQYIAESSRPSEIPVRIRWFDDSDLYMATCTVIAPWLVQTVLRMIFFPLIYLQPSCCYVKTNFDDTASIILFDVTAL